MSFAFHAAPPPGEWCNDPNGLAFAHGAWRLFVQHSVAAPDFGEIGWARLSSADLLHWNWDGPVIPSDNLGQAYSGSVVAGDETLSAYLTRHDGAIQRQVSLTSEDAGASWRQGEPLGPEGRNVRDPFVFYCAATGDWRMLVAEPCDWNEWASEAPSTLGVWRLERDSWRFVARIGPWMEPGVMWEMPRLVDFGSHQALIVSTVDRRHGRAACAVRYWLGQFDGANFSVATAGDGLLLDHGPDFYAAIVDSPAPASPTSASLTSVSPTSASPTSASPTTASEARMLVAWASNWDTARSMAWPGGGCGGPMTLPRLLSLDRASGRLMQRPVAGIEPAGVFSWDGQAPKVVTLVGEDAELSLAFDRRGLHVRRRGLRGLGGLLDWERSAADAFADEQAQTIGIFNDAGLIEVFVAPAGLTVTAFVPGARLQATSV